MDFGYNNSIPLDAMFPISDLVFSPLSLITGSRNCSSYLFNFMYEEKYNKVILVLKTGSTVLNSVDFELTHIF